MYSGKGWDRSDESEGMVPRSNCIEPQCLGHHVSKRLKSDATIYPFQPTNHPEAIRFDPPASAPRTQSGYDQRHGGTGMRPSMHFVAILLFACTSGNIQAQENRRNGLGEQIRDQERAVGARSGESDGQAWLKLALLRQDA